MDIVRARGQDPETCRELFILAAEILGVAAVSVGVSRLKPAAPTVERATVRTDTVKRDPMLRQMDALSELLTGQDFDSFVSQTSTGPLSEVYAETSVSAFPLICEEIASTGILQQAKQDHA